MKRLFRLRRHLKDPVKGALTAVSLAAVGMTTLHFSLAERSIPETPKAPTVITAEEKAKNRIIVKYKPTVADATADSSVASTQAEEINSLDPLDMRVLRTPDGKQQQVIEQLQQDPNVEYAIPDAVGYLHATTPDDPGFDEQDSLKKVLIDQLWDKHTGSSDVLVAFLDGGKPTHEDLDSGRYVPGHDFIYDGDDPVDESGHATFTNGIVAATANNDLGIAGACWSCRIMPLKISDAEGKGVASDLVAAIRFATDNGADIMNISFGGTGKVIAVGDAVEYASSKGVLIVASAGNDSTDGPQWPATYEPAIAVAGTRLDDSLDPNSNFGPDSDVAAPYTVYSTAKGGGYVSRGGTSYSAPLVTGIAAILKSAFPDATAAQLRDAITSTAEPCCDGKIDGGRANAIKAYDKLAAANPTPPPAPPPTPPPTTPPPTTPPPTTPPPTTPPKDGDLNDDGKVNLTDLSILLSNWGKDTPTADLNDSGKVDLTDLSMLLSEWAP